MAFHECWEASALGNDGRKGIHMILEFTPKFYPPNVESQTGSLEWLAKLIPARNSSAKHTLMRHISEG